MQQLAALRIPEPVRHGPAQELARPRQHLVLAVLGLEKEQSLQGCAHPTPNESFGPVLEATGIDHAQELPAQLGLAALRKEEGQQLARKSPLQEAAQAGPRAGEGSTHDGGAGCGRGGEAGSGQVMELLQEGGLAANQIWLVRWPEKDANEWLKAGAGEEQALIVPRADPLDKMDREGY